MLWPLHVLSLVITLPIIFTLCKGSVGYEVLSAWLNSTVDWTGTGTGWYIDTDEEDLLWYMTMPPQRFRVHFNTHLSQSTGIHLSLLAFSVFNPSIITFECKKCLADSNKKLVKMLTIWKVLPSIHGIKGSCLGFLGSPRSFLGKTFECVDSFLSF